jgi:DNA invertase Pin-like site-specific DNA recombinase
MTESFIPVAQYLRMSTEHQRYSLECQTAIICSYAKAHGFIVVKTYTDAGKSGLVLKHREGLAQLLHDVVAGGQTYRAILVYDVSRWGRFQDADEAAHYEYMCKKSGIPVVYCAESFSSESTMPNAIMKALKRVMAAEYSRELSDKVLFGMSRLVSRGLWPGSVPGFGLRRMLVSSEGQRKQIMTFGEHKNLRSDHTMLVHGPKDEVDFVREIFRMYVNERRSTTYIARTLNERGIPHGDSKWNYQAVRKMLGDGKYAGSLEWGRYTQKLTGHAVPVPKEKWLVAHGVVEPIIDRKTFETAQKIHDGKTHNTSDQALLAKARRLLKIRGRLNADILNRSAMTPSASCYIARFGSLRRMYQLLDYKRSDTFLCRIKSTRLVTALHRAIYKRLQKLFPGITAIHESTLARPKTLRFPSGLTVSVVVCLAERTLTGLKRWRFQSIGAKRAGLITLMCRCNTNNSGIYDYVVMPNVSHIRVVSLLSEDDKRLESGVRLKRLRDFRRVSHALSNLGPGMAVHSIAQRQAVL